MILFYPKSKLNFKLLFNRRMINILFPIPFPRPLDPHRYQGHLFTLIGGLGSEDAFLRVEKKDIQRLMYILPLATKPSAQISNFNLP